MGDTAKEAAFSDLAVALDKHGAECTSDETTFTELLKTLSAPTEQAVADALTIIVKTGGKWNIPVLVDGLKGANPALDWNHIACYLDSPLFSIPDSDGLAKLMAAWSQATDAEYPLKSIIGGLWNNAVGQISFLKYAVNASPEIFPWLHAEPRQEPLEGLHGSKSSTGTPNGCWLALDLYSTLAALADSGHSKEVKQLLETPLKTCPEIILLGAATVKGSWGPLQADVLDNLVAMYVSPHPNSSAVLSRLWHINPDIIMKAMTELHNKDPTSVARSMDVCQDLRALPVVLDATSAPFCFELASLGARREYLNLEKWLSEQFSSRGVGFMQSAVSFLDAKLQPEALVQPTSPVSSGAPPRLNISMETLAVFLRVLAANAGTMPTDTLQQLKLLQALAVQRHPELTQVISEFAGMDAFPADVEEEANNTFQKMFNDELSVESIVAMLNSYKNSTLGREQEIFACMVHNLFDEFRFFFKYPEKQLHQTAILFGQLVAHSLVSSVSLGIALRYVLEALRSEPTNKMFKFGITAAKQFEKDLAIYPSFAKQLATVPGLKDTDLKLLKAAELAVEKTNDASSHESISTGPEQQKTLTAETLSTAVPNANTAGFPTSMPTAPSNPNALFSTINAETLEQAAQSEQQNASYAVPDKKTVDRVHFIVNNITLSNVDAKTKELAALVTSTYHLWFVNYLVVKRAAQEPNYHKVYVSLVSLWGDRSLERHFVRSTVHYCKVMLGSKLLKTNSSERTLLKNLGGWLGKLTLARNRPVLQRELDVKSTLIEAYQKGQLLPVLSFVRHLLEPCADSKAFRPPNPWVMAILALLAEVYSLDGLRTSHKFEVELLFKQMDLQLADVTPSSLLVNKPRDTSADNMDFQPPKIPTSTTVPASPSSGAIGTTDGKPTAPGGAGSAATAATSQGPVVDPNLLQSLSRYLVINQQLAPFEQRGIPLGKLTHLAVERAVVEIISPVVDRSVTIACMTSQELVSKDFAVEPEADVMRRAAHLSVAGLAQSLALATAREPLRLAVTSNLRALLSGGQMDQATLDQVVTLLVSDNLDVCSQVIERAAADRAQRELDERLQGAYNARIRAKSSGQRFADPNYLQGRFPSALPEALRARPGALTPQQQKVYQDFATIPRTVTQATQAAIAPRAVGGSAEIPASTSSEADGQATAQLRSRFISWIQRMDAVISQSPGMAITSLPDGHEAKSVVAEVATLTGNELQALEIAKNIFNKMVSGAVQSRLHVTAYAASLAVLREASLRRLPVNATTWLGQLMEANSVGTKESTEALLRMGLLVLPDLDGLLAKALASPRYQSAAETLCAILQSCVLGQGGDPCLSTADLAGSIDVLTRLASRTSNGGAVLLLIQRAQAASASRSGGSAVVSIPGTTIPSKAGYPQPVDPPEIQQAIMAVFDKWVNIMAADPGEQVHAGFIADLRRQGLWAGDEASERFVRVMATLALAHCLRSAETAIAALPPGVANRPVPLNFVAPDAFVRLMVCLIVHHNGGLALLSRVLGIIATLLLRDADERGAAFNGRPYFRLMIGFLSELSPTDDSDETGNSYLQSFAGFLHAVRPSRAPSFALPWLQLVADRRFMPRLLMAKDRSGWAPYLHLLLAQLVFLEPFLRNGELTDATRLLYKGTLRIILVLLHDFPEFLCEFHFRLCDVIPASCVQMRNLVLSAFPRGMNPPDPLVQESKVDMPPEVAQVPRYSPQADALLPNPLRAEVDAVLAGQVNPSTASPTLQQRIIENTSDALVSGSRYNIQLMNALVFYIGVKAVEASAPKPGAKPVVSGTTAMSLYSTLLRDFDAEGRYLAISAMANHLRYPNAHTNYFSSTIHTLFAEATSEDLQEQITRVLLERLVVSRPHPWGLLVAFIELIKNPRFNFWSHSFTHSSPEVEKVLETVARSCIRAQAPAPQGTEALKGAA